jgi:hypothetical protein
MTANAIPDFLETQNHIIQNFRQMVPDTQHHFKQNFRPMTPNADPDFLDAKTNIIQKFRLKTHTDGPDFLDM